MVALKGGHLLQVAFTAGGRWANLTVLENKPGKDHNSFCTFQVLITPFKMQLKKHDYYLYSNFILLYKIYLTVKLLRKSVQQSKCW